MDNQIQNYVLHGDQLRQYFEIYTPSPRDFQLRLREPLDYEKQRSFTGSVEAYASAQATFRLDDRTGVVTLASRLRAHVRQKYSFKVRVKESSASARTSDFHQQTSLFSFPVAGPKSDTIDVIVNVLDINNFAPEIFLIDSMEEDGDTITVPENTDATLILTLRVRDRDLGDNGEVSCALDDSNDVGYKFRLNREPDPSLYTLHTRRRFDAEVEPAVVLNITCWDSGSPRQSTSRQIVVRIGDENEYAPVFNKQEYTASVVENARANQPVLQVSVLTPLFCY
ncbi:unnamed protein product [Dibothriocephalus latus]|uniref:Cadherin domain-containing protein n=1 Tax=Dibothriocephalus latus TaxID=60516 RepID=A0A3P7N4T1_DIBLA|nr:unnamed protein product [Dibothriocephalus latus]